MTETGFVPQARYMMRALDLAKQAAAMGEVPVGAVVVQKSTGRIIGEGYNRREIDRSPLAHAEIMAIDAASRNLGGWRLLDSVLYVTLEPCPMCAGAILHARLDQVVYGASDPKGGAVDSVEHLFTLPYNWTPEVHAGLLQAECAQVLKDFFRDKYSRLRSAVFCAKKCVVTDSSVTNCDTAPFLCAILYTISIDNTPAAVL